MSGELARDGDHDDQARLASGFERVWLDGVKARAGKAATDKKATTAKAKAKDDDAEDAAPAKARKRKTA